MLGRSSSLTRCALNPLVILSEYPAKIKTVMLIFPMTVKDLFIDISNLHFYNHLGGEKMVIRYDTHMHSSFSTDSEAPMESMVRSAIDHGLEGICLTEHMDLDYPTIYYPDIPNAFAADPDQVQQELFRLREMYKGRLWIGFGLEFGMQSHLSGRFHEIASDYPLDFIIASQHLAHSLDPYYPQSWDGQDIEEFITSYYLEMYENIQSMQEWDTLAHIDYIIRYIPGRSELIRAGAPDAVYDSMKAHREIIDEILLYVIRSGKCLEVNTAGYKYGLGQPHPAPSILRRYHELGGRLITIGADAHAPEHVAIGFDKVRDLLLSYGFDSYCVFKERRMQELPL